MKINKKYPLHWVLLLIFVLNVFLGLLIYPFLKKKRGRIVLYGHRLNGNLKSIYDYWDKNDLSDYDIHFLSMDSGYLRGLQDDKISVLLATRFTDIVRTCCAEFIVTDHGPHALYFLNLFTSINFIDVWHGVPFKGWDARDFRYIAKYKRIFVVSPLMKRMYTTWYGFSEEQVKTTGYGRTDQLISGAFSRSVLMKKYGFDESKSVVLYAPTWSHERGRLSDLNISAVIDVCKRICNDIDATFVIRTHLNTDLPIKKTNDVLPFSARDYPDAEELIFLADLLLTDWSSIAFDYLLLQKPIIFLERDPPFEKGFSLGPCYRFGPVCANLSELPNLIGLALLKIEDYFALHEKRMTETEELIYGPYADGHSAERYFLELSKLQ